MRLEKRAYAYGKKHNLDLDDGGGGSEKAGERYNKIWEKYNNIEVQLYSDVHKKMKNELNKKYGQKAMERYYKEKRIKTGVAAAGATLAGIGATVLTVKAAKAGARLLGKGIKKGAKAAYNYIRRR